MYAFEIHKNIMNMSLLLSVKVNDGNVDEIGERPESSINKRLSLPIYENV